MAINDKVEQLEIGEVAEIVNEMVEGDRSRDVFYGKVDEAVRAEFRPDPAITAIPWVGNRHHGSMKIADARNAATRIFSSLMPAINISPTSDEEYESHRVETAETVLEWEFTKMNRVGRKPVHMQLVEDAVTYHSVAFQVVDLEHMYKDQKKDPRIAAMLRARRFDWIRHHPGTVHAQYSDIGTEAVAKVGEYSLMTLRNNYGQDNPGIAALLREHGSANRAELMRARFRLVDYMSWNHRVRFVVPAQGPISDSKFVITNERHGLPFFPWVVVDFGEPLWKSLIMSGQWENFLYLQLIRFAKAVEQGTRSTMVIKTPDGTLQRVWMDFTNPSNPIVVPLDGTDVDQLSPAPIDPQLENMFQQMSSDADSSTVARILQDASRYSEAPFSTFSAVRTDALGQLNPAKSAAETAYGLGFLKMVEWINYTKNPLMGYRDKNRDSRIGRDKESLKRGEIVGIYPASDVPGEEAWDAMSDEEQIRHLNRAYFDTSGLYLDIHLQAYSQSDEQARMNTQILAMEKLGVSMQEAYEKMGWKNYQLIKNQRAQELLDQHRLSEEMQAISMEVRERVRQEVMQEMQAQQEEQAKAAAAAGAGAQSGPSPQTAINEMNAGSQFASLEGVDMRGGGQPAAGVAPGETREQVRGRSNGGQSLQ